MRHRMYDPRIGRFTQMEPLTWNRPFSHYTYAGNNPVSASDPTGLITESEVRQYRGLMRRYLNQWRQAIENDDVANIDINLRRYKETATVLRYELMVDQAVDSHDHLVAERYRSILAGKRTDAVALGVDFSGIKPDKGEAAIQALQRQNAVMALGANLEGVETEALVLLMTLPLEAILARAGARGVGREILGYADDFTRMAGKAKRVLQSGARTLGDGDYDAAEAAYKVIRASDDDIVSIAKNTGIREDRVRRIKNHLFNATHQLDDGVRRFDADPAIVNAWRRLQQGAHVQGDANLLMHELFESRFEGIFKSTYRAAHEAAERAGRPGLPR